MTSVGRYFTLLAFDKITSISCLLTICNFNFFFQFFLINHSTWRNIILSKRHIYLTPIYFLKLKNKSFVFLFLKSVVLGASYILENGKLGQNKNKTFLSCVSSHRDSVVTGTAEGDLLLFQGNLDVLLDYNEIVIFRFLHKIFFYIIDLIFYNIMIEIINSSKTPSKLTITLFCRIYIDAIWWRNAWN